MQRAAPLSFRFETKPRSSSINLRLSGGYALVLGTSALLAVKTSSSPALPTSWGWDEAASRGEGKVVSNEEVHVQEPAIM